MTDDIRHFADREIVGDSDITIDVLGSIIDFSSTCLPTCYYNNLMNPIEFKHPTKELNELCKVGDSIRALNIFRHEYIGFKKSDFNKTIDNCFLALNSVCYNLFFTKVDINKWMVEYGRMCADSDRYLTKPIIRSIVIDPSFTHTSLIPEPQHHDYPVWDKDLVLSAKIERSENGKD